MYFIKVCVWFLFCFSFYVVYTALKLVFIYRAKIKTFIIQIANTILNQCISLCLYKIGHIN